MKKAIVIAGSRGIGKAIADALKSIDCQVKATSQKELDTSDLENVKEFVKENTETDILVLNTGGPPGKQFSEVTEEDWQKYHNQLFLVFAYLLNPTTTRLYCSLMFPTALLSYLLLGVQFLREFGCTFL